MAFRMRHWIEVVAVGCALVAIGQLPPEAPGAVVRPAPTALAGRRHQLGMDVERTRALLQRLRWADSLPPLLASGATGGVDVGGPPELADSTLMGIRDRVEVERGELGVIDPDMLFGYYIQFPDQGAPSAGGVPPLGAGNMAGTVDGRPYCITVTRISRNLLATGIYARHPQITPYAPGSRTGLLGACGPFVQFGLPGSHVAAWLKNGGIAFAYGGDPASSALPDLWLPRSTVPAFARTEMRTIPGPALHLDACLAGRDSACLEIALRGAQDVGSPGASSSDSVARFVANRSPFYLLRAGRQTSSFGEPGLYLLADLEREFGPAAFRRFWTSNQDVPTAFRNAFGLDMGHWLVRWTADHVYHYRAGPSLPRSAVAGSILLVLLCGGIAGAWATRRSVR